MDTLLLVVVVATALGFSYTNGFHDSANAIATSVTTRALNPRVAVTLAALGNLFGAFLGAGVADTVGRGLLAAPSGRGALVMALAALLAAITWNLVTWWRGLPSSSTHALLAGVAGAASVLGIAVDWSAMRQSVLLPMVLSPLVGLLLGYVVMGAVVHAFRDRRPADVSHGFRVAQALSATAMAFGHGMQDAAKGAGMIVLALSATGRLGAGEPMPLWVLVSAAVMISLGSYAGGWRIIRTVGGRLVDLDPPQGFAAEASAAVTLVLATVLRAPVSTTLTLCSAIVGVGAAQRGRRVRRRVAREIISGWLLTIPVAAVLGAGLAVVLRALVGT